MKKLYFPLLVKPWKEAIDFAGSKCTPEADSWGFIEVYETKKKLIEACGDIEYMVVAKKEEE